MLKKAFIFNSEKLDKNKRLCFIKDDNGKVWFDINEKAPVDTAVYIPCDKQLLKKALEDNSIEKALDSLKIEDLYNQVIDALKNNLLQSFGLAKKSGLVVLGLEKVKENYHKGQVAKVFLATDAGGDVTKRVNSWDVLCYTGLKKIDISKALGGENISLVGFLNKPQIENIYIAMERYKNFL